jgi:glycine cleavage system T protein
MPRKLPLHEAHQAAGATFLECCGWEVPARFSSIEAEHEALGKRAGLLDLSHSGTIEVSGDDRVRFLHGMLTNDIKSLQPGKGCYAAFLTAQGRMVGDLRVFCLSDTLLLTTEPCVREKLAPALAKYVIGERPRLVDRSDELAILSVQGPCASQALSQLSTALVLPEEPFDHLEAVVADTRIQVCRVKRAGAGGYDLILPKTNLSKLWKLLLEQGRACGLQPVGLEGYNIQRIEAGIPWYGFDMDESTLPIEAGLEKSAISFNKGCYIGQEPVARITFRGHVNRKLSGLLLAGECPASRTDKVFSGDQQVGWVTSSGYSFSLRRPIALCYLRREVLEPGTSLRIETDKGPIESRVASLPFVHD